MFIGHLFIFLTSDFYFDSGKRPANWTIYYFGICIFVYLILDNADGKQARKTGNSSPLGLLFDHGCDSINISLSCLSFIKILGVQDPYLISIGLISTNLGFYFCTLEEYYTGSLDLGIINPVDEGSFAAIIITLQIAIMGNSFWMKESFINNFNYGELIIVLTSIFTLLILIISIIKMIKISSIVNILKNCVTIFSSVFIFILSITFLNNNTNNLLLLCYLFSIIYCRITIMLQISHISNEKLNKLYIFPWVFNLLVFCSIFYLYDYKFYYLLAIFILATLYFIYFITHTCIIISKLLEIRVFFVKNKNLKNDDENLIEENN